MRYQWPAPLQSLIDFHTDPFVQSLFYTRCNRRPALFYTGDLMDRDVFQTWRFSSRWGYLWSDLEQMAASDLSSPTRLVKFLCMEGSSGDFVHTLRLLAARGKGEGIERLVSLLGRYCEFLKWWEQIRDFQHEDLIQRRDFDRFNLWFDLEILK